MTTSNAHVNELEKDWESISWERKTIGHPSSLEHEIVVTFSANHANEIEAAKDYFTKVEEETDELVRSVWLASYSSGEKIVVVESRY